VPSRHAASQPVTGAGPGCPGNASERGPRCRGNLTDGTLIDPTSPDPTIDDDLAPEGDLTPDGNGALTPDGDDDGDITRDGNDDGQPGDVVVPPWNPRPWVSEDDLDGYVTPSQRFVDKAKRLLGIVVALALIVPAGAGLIDEWLFNRASSSVIEELREDPIDGALIDAVLLVTVARCDGSAGTGTAFAAQVDGRTLLLTNRHVVDGAGSIGLRTLAGDGGPQVTSTALSMSQDIAVLYVSDDRALPPALRIATRDPRAGTPVRTVGFPLALPFTTAGAVAEPGSRMLLDLQIDPGASGSPVVNDLGQVVGQVYARTDDDRGVATSAVALLDGLDRLAPQDLGC